MLVRSQSAQLGQVGDASPNVPNALTGAALALGVWWAVADGPEWAALASIVLDELDGRVARATGKTSAFGSQFDWASDVLLTALALDRAEAPWPLIPAVATGQVLLRNDGLRPAVGSARAVIMLYALARDRGLIP